GEHTHMAVDDSPLTHRTGHGVVETLGGIRIEHRDRKRSLPVQGDGLGYLDHRLDDRMQSRPLIGLHSPGATDDFPAGVVEDFVHLTFRHGAGAEAQAGHGDGHESLVVSADGVGPHLARRTERREIRPETRPQASRLDDRAEAEHPLGREAALPLHPPRHQIHRIGHHEDDAPESCEGRDHRFVEELPVFRVEIGPALPLLDGGAERQHEDSRSVERAGRLLLGMGGHAPATGGEVKPMLEIDDPVLDLLVGPIDPVKLRSEDGGDEPVGHAPADLPSCPYRDLHSFHTSATVATLLSFSPSPRTSAVARTFSFIPARPKIFPVSRAFAWSLASQRSQSDAIWVVWERSQATAWLISTRPVSSVSCCRVRAWSQIGAKWTTARPAAGCVTM